MSNQIVISSGAKVRELEGVLTGTAGIVSSVPLGEANGVATLDSGGKVPVSQLPSSVVTYLGTWNAATNTPTLVNGTGDAGDMYICNVAGTVNFGAGPIPFAVGDWVLYGSGTWQKSSGQNGTVTSVAASITGNAVGLTGSPITTAGTLAFAFSGTNLQYVNGAGNLTTFPTLITSIGLSMPSAFSVANSPLTANGTIAVTGAGTTAQYIRGDGSLATFPTIATEAQRLITEVYNETGATLTKGTVVYINGGHGNLPTITKAIATGDATSAQTYGIVQTDITNMNNGYVVVIGSLGDLDTQAYANGTQLYLSSTTAGAWTSTKQYAPAHLVYVGIVVRSHPTQGVVEVRIQNGFEMDELHNVSAQSPLNNQGLFYNTSTSLWENKSIATALGYTPANDANVVHLTGNETIGGTKTFSDATKNNGGIFLQNASSSSLAGYMNLGGLTNGVKFTSGGGISNTFTLPSATGYTFTFPSASGTIALTSDLTGGTVTSVAALTIGTTGTDLSSSVANSTTTPVITLNVPTASATNRGVLSSSDWSYFNGKQGTIFTTAPLSIISNTISITQASASVDGYLSSSDWSSFNGRVSSTGSTGYIAKFSSSSAITSSGLYDDGTTVSLISRALSGSSASFIVSSGTALDVAGNAIFRGDTGIATPRQLIISSGGSTPVYLEAKGYGANYQTDFGIKTFNNVGTAFEVFYADSSGRVGINQVSPSYQLDVNGTGRFSLGIRGGASNYTAFYSIAPQKNTINTDSSTAGNDFTGGQGYWALRTATDNSFNLDTYNSGTGLNALKITQTGATTFSSTILAGQGTFQSTGANIISKNTTTSQANLIRYDNSSGTARAYLGYETSGSAFYIENAEGLIYNYVSGGLALTLNADKSATFSSSVGIGASPASLLYAYSSTSTAEFRLERGGVGDVGARWKRNGSDLGYISNADWIIAGTSSTDFGVTAVNNLVFGTAATERMRITSDGNLLLGTTDNGSGAKLVFYSTTAAQQLKAAGTAPAITFSNTITSPTIGGSLGACTSAGQFLSGTAAGDMILINQFSGNRLYITNYSNGVYLTQGATSWTANSDIRLKNINSHIENAVEKLSTLQTINFSYKDDKTNKQNLGLIAQELEKIFPELIDKNGDGMLGVRYTELVPVLIKAVQELKLEIETLKNK